MITFAPRLLDFPPSSVTASVQSANMSCSCTKKTQLEVGRKDNQTLCEHGMTFYVTRLPRHHPTG